MFHFNFLLIFAIILVADCHDINDTCVDLSFEKLHSDFQSSFSNLADTPIYNHAKVMYQVANSADQISYDISVRWTKADMENKRTRTYIRDINLLQGSDGHLSKVSEGKVLCNLSKFVKGEKLDQTPFTPELFQ